MPVNQFFVKKGPFPLKEIINNIGCNGDFTHVNDFVIYGVESLSNATKNDMTFLNSSKYKNLSLKTKAAACITTSNLSKFLPDHCIKLDVKNTLFAVTQVSRMFYPKADIDYPDTNLLNSSELKKLYPNVDFYSGIFLKSLGFPTSMFTVLFAIGRTVGWVSQWKEMIEDPINKIGRPRQLYKGKNSRNYQNVDSRDKRSIFQWLWKK